MNTEKYLVAYFSRKEKEDSSNCSKLAQQLAHLLKEKGVDYEVFAIVPTETYPEDKEAFEMATKAERDLKARPELQHKLGGMKYVKDILLVTPNWWNDVPAAVRTFLDKYDFTGKKIVPVVSTAESGKDVREMIRDFLPDTWVTDGVDVSEKNTGNATSELNEAIAQLFAVSTRKH